MFARDSSSSSVSESPRLAGLLFRLAESVVNLGASVAPEEQLRAVRIVNLLAFMALLLGAASQFSYAFLYDTSASTHLLWTSLFMLGYIATLALNQRGAFSISRLTLLLVFFGSVFVEGSLIFPAESLVHLQLLVVVPAVTLIYERRSRGLRWLILALTALLFLLIEYSWFMPQIALDEDAIRLMVTSNVAVCAVAIGFVAFLFSVDTQSLVSSLEYRANYDPLTGLLNRRAFFRLRDSAQLKRSKGMGLLWIDIDGFKQVNDTHGHETGDRVLQFVVRQIKAHLREDSLFVRMGGDELVVLLNSVTEPEARRIAERLCDSVASAPYRENHVSLPLTISVGGAWNWDTDQLGEMMNAADEAMYRAKRLGKNRVEWHAG